MPYIHDEEFEQFLYECVTIDENDLSREFFRISSQIAYWARRAGRVEEEYLVAKAALKEAESRAFLAAKDELVFNGDKKPTKDTIEALANTYESVMSANQEFASVSGQRKEVQTTLDALMAKKDMLSQLGADRRKEMQAGIL